MWNDPAAGLDSVITRRMRIHISDFCLDHVSFWFSLWSVIFRSPISSLSLLSPAPPKVKCSCLHAYAQIPLQLIMSSNLNYVNYAMLWSKLVPVYFVVSTNEWKEVSSIFARDWIIDKHSKHDRPMTPSPPWTTKICFLLRTSRTDSKQVNASRKAADPDNLCFCSTAIY